MVQAYILIQTAPGRAIEVSRAVATMSETVAVHNVTGPYDVIATVQAATLDDLGRLVLARVQDLPGISRTLTCPIVEV